MKKIAIYGASGHGKVVADIAKLNGYEDIIFIDDGENEYPNFSDIHPSNEIFIAFGIGNNQIRAKLFDKVVENGFQVVSLIHPSAIISPSVSIDAGTVIMPNVVVNANTQIGKGVILNTSSVIEHDNVIGDFVHVSPKVALGGDVKVGKLTHIGIGSCIIQGIIVGTDTNIGAGSVVIKNIGHKVLAYGNPCKAINGIYS